MEQNDFYEKLRLTEEMNNKIFASIKLQFEKQNDKILFSLYNNGFIKINYTELIKCGFAINTLVKSDSRIENPLLGSITFYSENHFIGYDLKLDNRDSNCFHIIKTDNSINRFKQRKIIRDKIEEIKGLEYTAKSYIDDMECRDIELSKYYRELAKKAKLELIDLENDLKNIE